MFERRLVRALLVLLALTARPAGAVELFGDTLELNAYGTLGMARSSLDSPQYRTASNNRYGIGDSWSGLLDNRVGAQMTLNFNPDLSFILQSLIRRNGEDQVAPQTTWAYLRWRPNEHWETRLGRIRQPLFLITEEFDVGYAWPWVRPPVELYGLAGESTWVDGGQLRYRMPLGDYTFSIDSHYGQFSLDRDPYYSVKNTYSTGVAVSLSDANLTLRASVLQAHVQLDAPGLQGLQALIYQQNPQVADDYAVDDIPRQNYANLGLRYEDGDWLVMSEYVRLWLNTRSLPDKQAYYLTVGHVFGDWTPYVTYARQDVLSSLREDRLTGRAAAATNALLANSNTDQHTYSAGVRWDFSAGMALKAQVDQVYQEQPSVGLQGAQLPAGRDHFTVTSLVLDWAF
jgi:hypothetical protein